MENKTNMKFIRTTSNETAHKLRYENYTELPSQTPGEYVFLNDGKRLTFDVEQYGGIYTPRAVEATLAIIDTFTMIRNLACTMESPDTLVEQSIHDYSNQ